MISAVLRKSKRDGGFGRWPAYEFAADQFGLWLFSPAGTVYWGHDASGRVTEWEVGRGPDMPEGVAELWLVPPKAWWVAKWVRVDAVDVISVDICTPAHQTDGEWTFVDLELDPHWRSDGRIGIGDEDEFIDACEAGQISEAEAAAARLAADEVLQWLRRGVEPFGLVGWEHFEAGMASGLAPLRIRVDESGSPRTA